MSAKKFGIVTAALAILFVTVSYQNCGPLPDPKRETSSGSEGSDDSGDSGNPTPTPTPSPIEAQVVIDNAKITASSQFPGGPPAGVNDNNINTTWNAGQFHPAYIRFELDTPVTLTRMQLINGGGGAAGLSTHEIWAGNTLATLAKVADVSYNLSTGTDSNPTFNAPNVRFVEVRCINAGPEWISWNEIKLFETH